MIIIYDKKAKKYIETLDRPTKQRLHSAIKELIEIPLKGDIKVIVNSKVGKMRLRVGKYRVIFKNL